MAKITRIKASDGPRDDKPAGQIDEPPITRKKVVVKDKKSEKAAKKATGAKIKAEKSEVEKILQELNF